MVSSIGEYGPWNSSVSLHAYFLAAPWFCSVYNDGKQSKTTCLHDNVIDPAKKKKDYAKGGKIPA